MKHKILSIAALFCAIVFTSCSDLIAQLKEETAVTPTSYTITIADGIEHGKVSIDKTSAEAGETIKLTATADEGYELESYTVKDAGENSIAVTDGTFTMPKNNVTVSATFSPLPPETYTITIASGIENGTVMASKTSATVGEAITLTITPDTGYKIDTLTVKNGDEDVTVTDGTFTMPKNNVTVSATFSPLPPETANYTVRHLFQKTDASGYEKSESYPDETKSGKIGEETQAQAKTVTGFTAQSVTQATITAKRTTVEIKYDRNIYTVTFNSNGGSEVTSQTVCYEETATEPAAPAKESSATKIYTFAGWYTDSDLTASFTFDTAITEDITLYAKWNEKTIGSISYATTEVNSLKFEFSKLTAI